MDGRSGHVKAARKIGGRRLPETKWEKREKRRRKHLEKEKKAESTGGRAERAGDLKEKEVKA